MVQAQSSNEVIYNLKQECEAVKLFIRLLKKEEDALIHGRMDEVDFLVSEKNRAIEEISDYSAIRCQQLTSRGFTADRAGMDSWLALQPDNETIAVIWAELLQNAKAVQQLNHSNGMIIATRLQHVQHASAALQCASGNISLYGPKGQATVC